MSKIYQLLSLLGLCFLMFTICSFGPKANETVIYIVRHAEKDNRDPKNIDPELNAAGRQRVLDLNRFLKKEKISAVYATNYKRTMETADPVARRNRVEVRRYDNKDLEVFAKMVKSEFKDKKVLIVGHSNTVLELVKAFEQSPVLEKLNDDDYDLIFIIKLYKNGDSSLRIKRFGKLHHGTEIAKSKSTF